MTTVYLLNPKKEVFLGINFDGTGNLYLKKPEWREKAWKGAEKIFGTLAPITVESLLGSKDWRSGELYKLFITIKKV